MKALTVKQPWAMGIINAGKDVENRSWPTSYRGPLAIHAGRTIERAALDHPAWWTAKLPRIPSDFQSSAVTAFGLPVYQGAFIGVVELTACIRDSDSPWADPGAWHWVLENPRPLHIPIPAAGQLGLWKVPADVIDELTNGQKAGA